jgi:hypothetical protein
MPANHAAMHTVIDWLPSILTNPLAFSSPPHPLYPFLVFTAKENMAERRQTITLRVGCVPYEMDCVTVKDYIIKSVLFVCGMCVLLNFLKLFINSKHPPSNPLRGCEAAILTMKTLSGTRPWSQNIIPEATYNM